MWVISIFSGLFAVVYILLFSLCCVHILEKKRLLQSYGRSSMSSICLEKGEANIILFCLQHNIKCTEVYRRKLKGVVSNSNPIHFLSSSANMSSWSDRATQLVLVLRTTSLDNKKFDPGIICVYCEYSTLHLSQVSTNFITGVSKSINIHCF